ncbi:hypothetical protein MHBO_002909 [Bonamia ostreae]|uniref:J domain-containing protein n=1 Tax=Bonamia ostreae TaxID=126728 RepID=A0ABV2ANY0_9EUKA
MKETKKQSYRCPPVEKNSNEVLKITFFAAASAILLKVASSYRSKRGAPMTGKHSPGLFRNFYEGGFKTKMDRSEAALILGCRRTSPQTLILKKYRILINANHPDRGGSPYITRKINEAKAIMTNKK